MSLIIFGFVCGVIGYLGLIRAQKRWLKHGQLTEGRFVLLQVPVWTLLILTGSIAVSSTLLGTTIAVGLSLLTLVIGFPTARYIYRHHFLVE